MEVNIKGLINRLDSLRERLNYLFTKLEKLDDLEQEEIGVADVERFFENDDTFNLSIALDVLEQADKLDKALEIIKELVNIEVDLRDEIQESIVTIGEECWFISHEKAKLLKEVSL